ncbi:hypothetical protein DO62_1303 [Burkholderia pseudomallei]|nr:hypothetical protein DO62_1303 [Burkholderia pseudomallei]KGC41080.1 hypothetical protein DO66_2660 [Burkholderia pseudomallei]KGD11676.1 hypothetical protein DO70_2260 [Burkholderia pseudomallei]KGW66448.1 hypothetical protein Y042_5155 [Burkholderia pseudomallei MSHR1357]KGX00874.1 hypothetical protein Y601_5183 [Burkholderia pseudomallei MSHR640]
MARLLLAYVRALFDISLFRKQYSHCRQYARHGIECNMDLAHICPKRNGDSSETCPGGRFA